MTDTPIHNALGQPIGFEVDGWQGAQRPPHTSLTGTFCTLVPLDIDQHADDLYQAFSTDTDHRNWTYLAYGPFETFASFKQWQTATCTQADPFFHTVIDNKSKQAAGLASYLRIEPSVGVIEVGHIHFSPLIQRQPIATEAMFLMMKRVFDDLGYRRYEWKCDALNEPSRNAAIRLGFTLEGVFRQATMYKGRNRDTAWFSVIDSEWPALKRAFEHWLQCDNFDKNGQQKQSLSQLR